MIAMKTPPTFIVNQSGFHNPNHKRRSISACTPIHIKYHITIHRLRSETPKAKIMVKAPKKIPNRRGYRWAGSMTKLKPYSNLHHLIIESIIKMSPYAKRHKVKAITRGGLAS